MAADIGKQASLAAVRQMMDRQRRDYSIVRSRGCAGSEIRSYETHPTTQRLQPLTRNGEHLGREVEQRELRLGKGLGDHGREQARSRSEFEHFEASFTIEGQQLERRAVEFVKAWDQLATRA